MRRAFRFLQTLGLFPVFLEFGEGGSDSSSKSSKSSSKDSSSSKDYDKQLQDLKDSLQEATNFDYPTYPDQVLTTPEPTLPTSPATTKSAAEEEAAKLDARRQAQKRQGLLSTILAGEQTQNTTLGKALNGRLGAS